MRSGLPSNIVLCSTNGVVQFAPKMGATGVSGCHEQPPPGAGYIYVGPAYAVDQLSDAICPTRMHLELMRNPADDFPEVLAPEGTTTARVWHCRYRSLAPLSREIRRRCDGRAVVRRPVAL